jgi:hypothetical protein
MRKLFPVTAFLIAPLPVVLGGHALRREQEQVSAGVLGSDHFYAHLERLHRRFPLERNRFLAVRTRCRVIFHTLHSGK